MERTFVPVIYDCNDNCISCPVKRRGKKQNPSFEDIKEEIDSIDSGHIELNGGEPTLRDDILDIITYAGSKNVEVGLLTNAQAMSYAGFAAKIASFSNLKIITTLYGHSSTLHDAITRTPGSFKNKILGLRNLIKRKVPIELRILLHKMNYQDFSKIAKFIIDEFSPTDFAQIIIMNPKLEFAALEHKESVAVPLTKIARELGAVSRLDDAGFNVELYHFPYCVLPKVLWEYSAGLTSAEPEVVYAATCKSCDMKKSCSRIWNSYLKVFGPDEFSAVKIHIPKFEQKTFDLPELYGIDKLFFLLGLKPVLRFEGTDCGFEDFFYCTYKDYVFVSRDFKLAKEAKSLTKIDYHEVDPEQNRLLNSRIGELYGYPECCSQKFYQLCAKDVEFPSLMCQGRKLRLLHYPCSNDCKKTEALKKEILKRIKESKIKLK